MADILQMTYLNAIYSIKYLVKFHWNVSPRVKSTIIGSGNGLTSNRQQAITWTNDDQNFTRPQWFWANSCFLTWLLTFLTWFLNYWYGFWETVMKVHVYVPNSIPSVGTCRLHPAAVEWGHLMGAPHCLLDQEGTRIQTAHLQGQC